MDEWVKNGESAERVLWIHGLAGTGKSTIAKTVAESCYDDTILAATFFCSRDSAECSDIQNIFCTISYQLCSLYEPFKLQVLKAMKEDGDICQAQVSEQLKRLLVEPLSALKDKLVQHHSLHAIEVCRLYSLSAVLDYPLDANTDACMAKLARHCRLMLASVVDLQSASILEILLVIAGAYFGQDEELRLVHRALRRPT